MLKPKKDKCLPTFLNYSCTKVLSTCEVYRQQNVSFFNFLFPKKIVFANLMHVTKTHYHLI